MKTQSIGEVICHLRKEKGMTQADLAEKMNVSEQAVSKWERNIAYPDITTLSKLTEILETSVDALLKTFHQTTFQDAIEFVKFLYDWILHHIAVSDKQYVSAVLEFCRRNGA